MLNRSLLPLRRYHVSKRKFLYPKAVKWHDLLLQLIYETVKPNSLRMKKADGIVPSAFALPKVSC